MKNLRFFFKSIIALFAILLMLGSNTYATKHVMYMQIVYNTNPHFCINYPNDTMVVYKAPFCAGTTWLINGTPVATGDSLVYVPTGPGLVTVTSDCGTSLTVFLSFHVVQPQHADFYVNSGGQINSTQDTVWMCSSSVVVGTYANGDEATSWFWGSTTGFYSVDAPVTITAPGTYYLQRENPCGITRDTFEVVSLPTTIPIWHDTAFCNTSVSLLLDPGSGWNYSWNTGETTQTLMVSAAGTYTVNLSNVCVVGGSATIDVEHQTYPNPDLTYQQGEFMCADSVVVLNPSPGFSYDTYSWLPGGATTPTLTISGLTTGSGMYQVTVTKGGCSNLASGSFGFYQAPTKPEICIVTVDSTYTKNKIVFTANQEPIPGDMHYAPITSYNIYKAISGWSLIGNVPVDQEHTFVDMTSNPPSVSAVYKIASVDACGVESEKSYWQKTICLAVNHGATPGENPLLWNAYQDESGLFIFDMYYIYRGDSPTHMTLLDSVNWMITSYIDTGVYTQKYYQIAIFKATACDPTPAAKGEKSIVTGSYSNISTNTTGISDIHQSISVSIYPNPSTGIFHVEGANISKIEVLDMLGNILFTTSKTIDLSTYAKGIYNVRIISTMGSTSYKKIVVQ